MADPMTDEGFEPDAGTHHGGTHGGDESQASPAPKRSKLSSDAPSGTGPGNAPLTLPDGELGEAFERIGRALAALDATVDRHLENHLDNAAAAAEVQRLNADRARLARVLDEAEARAARLDEVNRDVSRRLVAAMETIRAVLEGQSG